MKWPLYAGLSALSYAGWSLFLRLGTTPKTWRDVIFFAAVAEMTIILALFWPRALPPAPVIGWGLAAGVMAAAGYGLFMMALSSSDSVMPTVIMSMYPILLVVLAAVFLHEQLTWTKGLGVALAVAAVWLVTK